MRISELKEERKGVTLVAIIDSLKEEITKTGETFVSAVLQDKSESLPVKFWSTSLQNINSSIGGRSLKGGDIVEIIGDVRNYNERLSVNVSSKNGDVPIRLRDDLQVDDYLYCSSFPPKKLVATVASISSEFKDEELKSLFISIFEKVKDRLLFYPFGTVYHKEKGGAVNHLFEVISRIKKIKLPVINGVQIAVDTDILYVAALASILPTFSKFDVDEITGKILEKKEMNCLLFSKNGALIEFCRFAPDNNEKLLAIKHCLMVLSDEDISPCIIEAKLLRSIVSEELNTYKDCETLGSIDGKTIHNGMFLLS